MEKLPAGSGLASVKVVTAHLNKPFHIPFGFDHMLQRDNDFYKVFLARPVLA